LLYEFFFLVEVGPSVFDLSLSLSLCALNT
jgi:hypothetical protein